MLRLAPEVPKSDSPLLTQALWRRGCGARRHNPLLTRRRATHTWGPRHRLPFAMNRPRTAHTNHLQHTPFLSIAGLPACITRRQAANHIDLLLPQTSRSKPSTAVARHSCSLPRFFWRDKPTRLHRTTSDSSLSPATKDHRPLSPRFILNRTPTFASSSGASVGHCPSLSCAVSSSQTCPGSPGQGQRPSSRWTKGWPTIPVSPPQGNHRPPRPKQQAGPRPPRGP